MIFCNRKKSSKAKKTELVERILNLIAGHSHQVSILFQAPSRHKVMFLHLISIMVTKKIDQLALSFIF